ncbi:MAG: choice-of-anchor Q domain-containing protein, partial [Roseimicrobium sp.]
MNTPVPSRHSSSCVRQALQSLCLALLCSAASVAMAQTIPNPSFETDTFATAPGYVSDNTAITGWTATPANRVGLNPAGGLNDFADNGSVPEGTQVAFIQSNGAVSTLSTTITGLVAGATYRIQFRANAGAAGTLPSASYRINGQAPVSFPVSPVNPPGTYPDVYDTVIAFFTATATTAALQISNSTTASSVLLVDDFTVVTSTVIQVTNTDDSGAGSLRQAFADAAATPDYNLITFAPGLNGSTIMLASELAITDSVGLDVEGFALAPGLTIDGGPGTNRIFSVNNGSILRLRHLTLTGGNGTGAVNSGFGGVISNQGTLTVTRCTFTNNTADYGAGIYSDGTVTLTQCTFSGNSGKYGAAVYNNMAMTMTHCTVSNNTVENSGGGILNANGMTLDRCIIAGNSAAAGPSPESGDMQNFTTLILKGTSFVPLFDNLGATNSTNGVINNADPLLGPLANNGGPTRTHALLGGSLARDAGTGSIVTSDQRGFPIVNTTPDVGAFEVQAGGVFVIDNTTTPQNYAPFEGTPATVTLRRNGNFSGAVTVRLHATDGVATTADYTSRANTVASNVVFNDGETTKNVLINTTTDALVEGNHAFTVTLSIPVATPGASLGSPTTAMVTIVDPIVVSNTNDAGPGSLRQAFISAAATPGLNLVNFAPALNGQTITLGSEIAVDDAGGVTVDSGNLAAGVAIDGGPGTNRIFHVASGSSLSLRRLTLTGGNGAGATASGHGGAVYNDGTLELLRCTLAANTANDDGGAILNNGTATLAHCTLSGNRAEGEGGGLHNQADATLTHCTLKGNSGAGGGGGIQNHSSVILDRCIVFGNSTNGGTGWDIYNHVSPASLTLVGTTLAQDVDNNGDLDGSGVLDPADPNLAPLGNNGGPTKTHALQGGSAARDAGTGSAVTSDQRGLLIVGDADLGAYEVQSGGVFVLATTGYAAGENSQATITINRTGGFNGFASVRLITTVGTASAGDFVGRPNTAASQVDFNDGETTKTVDISNVVDALVEANETYTVSLVSPSAGSSVGSPASVKVAILDPSYFIPGQDTVAPAAPVITSPAAGASVVSNEDGTVTITGTATDNKGVYIVRV